MARGSQFRPLVALLLLLGAAGPAAAADACQGAAAAVHVYAEAAQLGRWDAARALWSPTYLAFADTHSLVPRSAPGWWDAASPLVRHRDDLAAGRATLAVAARPDPEGAVATVTLTAGPHAESFSYAVVHEDGDWRLAGRLWGASRRWPVLETRFFHVRHPAGHVVDPGARDLLDAFVTDAAARLGGDAAVLAAAPPTYLVAEAATVEDLTGHPTVGMVDVAAGIVVSSHFPHFHEVVHLLAGRLRADLPVAQLPVLQEGLACLLGGRWGRSPEVVLHQGRVMLDWEAVTPSDLLPAAGFHAAPGGPDAAYAVAALVCDTIVQEAGWGPLIGLLEAFSGPAAAASADEVATAVARACGWEPADDPRARLDAAVRERSAAWRTGGVAPDRGDPPARPGITDGAVPWRIRVEGGEGPVVLLWGRPDDDPARRASSVFTERVPDRIWLGRRWGLACTPTSVSFYDFVANRVEGVWVADFTGDAPLDAADLRLLLREPPAAPVTDLVVHRPGKSP